VEDVVESIGTRGVRVTMGATIDEPVRGRDLDAFDHFDLAIERMLDALEITVWHVTVLSGRMYTSRGQTEQPFGRGLNFRLGSPRT
jgi:hypothetical protein